MTNPKPLVMIHGLLGSIDYFSPASLLEGIAVHTPDLLGYGMLHNATEGTQISLDAQARHVADHVRQWVRQPAWLLGHSVGGAVAMLAAAMVPELVCGVISVEGNFTLNDAFWCRKIAPLDEQAWFAEYNWFQRDTQAWLRASDIEPTAERLSWARRILDNQPASTVLAMARAVVAETGRPSYLETVKAVIDRGIPVSLIAGESSRPGWDVPAWVSAAAECNIVLPGVGHMMMLEAPEAFCQAVRGIVER